jgi:hypothetical protein
MENENYLADPVQAIRANEEHNLAKIDEAGI